MSYRYDEDLEFLKQIDSKDLDDLVYVLTHDKEMVKLFHRRIRQQMRITKKFFQHTNTQDIVRELQC